MLGSVFQNISPEELALLSTLIREDVLRGLDGLQALNYTANMTLGDALTNGQRFIGNIPMSPALLSLAMKCIGSESQLATAFDAFNEYHGPLPIPSLDAFVGLGKLIRQAIGIFFPALIYFALHLCWLLTQFNICRRVLNQVELVLLPHESLWTSFVSLCVCWALQLSRKHRAQFRTKICCLVVCWSSNWPVWWNWSIPKYVQLVGMDQYPFLYI